MKEYLIGTGITVFFSAVIALIDNRAIEKGLDLTFKYKMVKWVALTSIYTIVAIRDDQPWGFVLAQLMTYSIIFDGLLNLLRDRNWFDLSPTTTWPPERWAASGGIPGVIIYNFIRLFIIAYVIVNQYIYV